MVNLFKKVFLLILVASMIGCIGNPDADGTTAVGEGSIDIESSFTPNATTIVDATDANGATVLEAGEIAASSSVGDDVGSNAPVLPTATPEPLVATVNGTEIKLSAFQRELTRYEDALRSIGQEPGAGGVDYRGLILDQLIEQELIRQTAVSSNITISSDEVTTRMDELRETAGGAEGFTNWLAQNQFEEYEFFDALTVEMLTERVVNFITADVPNSVEMVRARYIQVNDETLANEIHARLVNGGDFADEARQFSLDRTTGDSGGDLGFFARNTLFVTEVEEASFSLALNELSNVITVANEGSETRYYIVQPLELDPARALTATERSPLLQQQFEAWLNQEKASADIQRFTNS